jgi:hypothetical protein
MYNNEDFNIVVNAAKNGENELLAVVTSGISINVKNEVNHIFFRKYNII